MELEVAGHAVNFVSINKDDAVATQEEIVKHCSFPQLQDTEALGLWDLLGGGKDDFYIFDAEGKLQTYFRFFGSTSTTLSEPEDYQTVKQAIRSVLDGKTGGPEPGPEPGRDASADPEIDEGEVSDPIADVDEPGPAPDTATEPEDAMGTLDTSPGDAPGDGD